MNAEYTFYTARLTPLCYSTKIQNTCPTQ